MNATFLLHLHPKSNQGSGFGELHGDVDKVNETGHCDWCNTIHLRCKCDAVTGIPDVFYNESVGPILVVRLGYFSRLKLMQ